MKIRKNLLIINHDFPPAGGAGIKRCLKFIKFLPEHGWQITVLTVKNGHHFIFDSSLLREISPNVTIHRTYTFESLFITTNEEPNNPAAKVATTDTQCGSLIKRQLRQFYNAFGSFLKVPDSRILWLPSALVASLNLILKKQFDVIFATGPTFVNFMLAALTKCLSGKPLVIDFRDAWLADPMLIDDVRPYLLKVHRILENFVINQADRVISTNPFVTRDFQRRYQNLDSRKFLTIYNGYDIDDFAFMKSPQQSKKDKFSIVYTGRLYMERTPKYFLKALAAAIVQKPEMRNNIEVIFVGSCEDFLNGRNIQDYLKRYNLEEYVKLTGQISRKESLEYQMSASLLLLLIGIVPLEMELTYGLSGKVFDYMLSKKPILTLANNGATREFIEKNKIGSVYYHKDIEGIKKYLMNMYEKFVNRSLDTNYELSTMENYDFRSLAKNLSDQLEDAISHNARHHGY